jgi:hypothetical protein
MILRGQLRGKIGNRRFTCLYGRLCFFTAIERGSGSVVEHFLAKEDVAGSNPVSRFLQNAIMRWRFLLRLTVMCFAIICFIVLAAQPFDGVVEHFEAKSDILHRDALIMAVLHLLWGRPTRLRSHGIKAVGDNTFGDQETRIGHRW